MISDVIGCRWPGSDQFSSNKLLVGPNQTCSNPEPGSAPVQLSVRVKTRKETNLGGGFLGRAAVNVRDVGPLPWFGPLVFISETCRTFCRTRPGPRGVPTQDGAEAVRLSSSSARLEERGGDPEVRTERWKKRRLLLQVVLMDRVGTGCPETVSGSAEQNRAVYCVEGTRQGLTGQRKQALVN